MTHILNVYAYCIIDSEDAEYWVESDSDLKLDCDIDLEEPISSALESHQLDDAQENTVWWLVAFTCIIQSLHSLPVRSVEFLLNFLGALLSYLGRYSRSISVIAGAFPRTLHTRAQYLQDKLFVPPIIRRVVCTQCHALYKFADCFDHCRGHMLVKKCIECKQHASLLKEVSTSTGNKRFYPHKIYPYCSLISVLQAFFQRPGFLDLCCSWQNNASVSSTFTDVYSGRVWKEFMYFKGRPFLSEKNSLALMLNIDWFQPFKHRTYSIGVMYLVFMNLPRNIRFKRENVVLLGLIPGPSEPPLHINTYLTPIVVDLLALWRGVSFTVADNSTATIRCALLCIACDLPAGRKVCGFLSHAANLGCSKCYCTFSSGVFGKRCYAGFERTLWVPRSNERHRRDIAAIRTATTKTERKKKEKELGCRYSCLLQLPYFNAVKMLIVDPMHNL